MSASNPPKYNYGVHFPEPKIDDHPGYLLVEKLGRGAFGEVLLVQSITDGQHYVRKIQTNPSPLALDTTIQSCEYNLPNSQIDEPLVKTAITFQFCNGGTLGDLFRKLSLSTHANMVNMGMPQVEVKIPEIFIWRFFDAMMTLLTDINRKGLAHSDLHAANIYIHWPLPICTMPEVFIGDWGCLHKYPWSDHPSHRFRQPFLISDFHGIWNVAKFRPDAKEEDMYNWYQSYASDFLEVATHLTILMTGYPESKVKNEDQYCGAAKENAALGGYSAELVSCFGDLWHLFDQLVPCSKPDKVWRMQNALRQRVNRATKRAEDDFFAGDWQAPNSMQVYRHPMPTKEVARWPTYNAVAPMNLYVKAEIVNAANDIDLRIDWGHFEVRRITKAADGSKWVVVEYDDYSDDEKNPSDDEKDDDQDAPKSPEEESPDNKENTQNATHSPDKESPDPKKEDVQTVVDNTEDPASLGEGEGGDETDLPLLLPATPLHDQFDIPQQQSVAVSQAENLRKRALHTPRPSQDITQVTLTTHLVNEYKSNEARGHNLKRRRTLVDAVRPEEASTTTEEKEVRTTTTSSSSTSEDSAGSLTKLLGNLDINA